MKHVLIVYPTLASLGTARKVFADYNEGGLNYFIPYGGSVPSTQVSRVLLLGSRWKKETTPRDEWQALVRWLEESITPRRARHVDPADFGPFFL